MNACDQPAVLGRPVSDESPLPVITAHRPRRRLGRLAALIVMITAAAVVVPAQFASAGEPRPLPPAVTKGAIWAAYTQALTGGTPPEFALAAIEDGPELAATLAVARQNYPDAVRTFRVSVRSISLTGPSQADVQFAASYQGGSFGDLSGTAVVSGGRWKVSRQTYCNVLRLAGATCPPKVGPQPVDPAAARLAVQQAYGQALTSGQGPDHSLAAVEDGPALAATLAQATANFPQATSTATVTTSDIIFTDTTHAALNFHVSYQGGVDFGVQQGTAVLTQNQWKVSRTTYCTVLSWANATCPAPSAS